MKNNNKEIVEHLARKEYASDKRRSMILTGAVAFAVMTLFCVFSLAVGKIETDILREARTRGTIVNTILERATEEQYEQIQKLSYIEHVGRYIKFGNVAGVRSAVVDEVAWEKIKKPAFTDIHGTYPKEKMEIMLPMSALELMGISEPEIGMEIPVTVDFFDGRQEKYNFRLSGYYTEYIATILYGPPDGYFSQAFLDSISWENEPDLTLLLKQDDRIEGYRVESRLYRDITMRDSSQQFIGESTVGWQAFFSLSGGFDSALILAVVILISAGLLIYNVLHISFERSIREYGLLKTLGTTTKQLRSIVFRQVRITVFRGSILGAAAGSLIALVLIPALLSRMYLYRLGSAAGMISFHPGLLVLSLLFGSGVTFLSSAFAIRKTVKLTPVEAVNYMEKAAGETYVRKTRRSRQGQRFRLWKMAWRNILRFKRRYFVSAICLTMGFVVSLGVIMISRGSDTTNQIEHDYSDFSVGTNVAADQGLEYYQYTLFPEAIVRTMENLPEVQKSERVRGSFGEVLIEQEALKFYMEDVDTDWYFYRAPAVVQIMSDEYLEKLKEFSQKNGLYLNVDKVIDGEGVILLHDHQLSPAQIEQSKEQLGMPVGIYSLENGRKAGDMEFCGYLDSQLKGQPEFLFTIRGGSICYFFASEKGFRKLGLKEATFDLHMTALPEDRVALNEKLKTIVNEYNKQFESDDLYERSYLNPLTLDLFSKIDVLASMRDYIVSNRLVMGSICVILLLMGLVNYINVTITSLTVRKKEFAVMESIGLTRKQLRKMLILEGVFYSFIIMVLTGAAGSVILYQIGKFMKMRMSYFVASYPVMEYMICIAGLFLSCILIVLLLYRKCRKDSIARRLRIAVD
mgnify:CR=1 FL=1